MHRAGGSGAAARQGFYSQPRLLQSRVLGGKGMNGKSEGATGNILLEKYRRQCECSRPLVWRVGRNQGGGGGEVFCIEKTAHPHPHPTKRNVTRVDLLGRRSIDGIADERVHQHVVDMVRVRVLINLVVLSYCGDRAFRKVCLLA